MPINSSIMVFANYPELTFLSITVPIFSSKILDYLGISYWKTFTFVSTETTFSSKVTKSAITFIDLYSSKMNFKIQNLSIIPLVAELNNCFCYLKVRESNWRNRHKWYIYDSHKPLLPSEIYWRWSNICWYSITIVSVKYTIMRT